MKIILKDDKKGVEFMGIERPELDALVQYFKERTVKFDMEAEQAPPNKIMAAQGLIGDDDDESDD